MPAAWRYRLAASLLVNPERKVNLQSHVRHWEGYLRDKPLQGRLGPSSP